MYRALYLFCLFVVLAPGVSGQEKRFDAFDPLTWSRYTVKGEEFSVILPSRPSMATTGSKEGLERRLTIFLDGIQYAIDVIQNSRRQSLDEFIAEYNTKGEDVKHGRDVTVDGVAGREFSTQNPVPATAQYFATEQRLYRFVAVGADVNNAAVKQFFYSIMLGKKADGLPVSDGPGMPLQLETGERIYKGKEVDKKLRLISKPEPQCPGGCERGKVVLQAIFSKTGRVVNIQVISTTSPYLADRSIAAAEKIRFDPAMKNGQYVSMYMMLEYYFNL